MKEGGWCKKQEVSAETSTSIPRSNCSHLQTLSLSLLCVLGVYEGDLQHKSQNKEFNATSAPRNSDKDTLNSNELTQVGFQKDACK